MEWICKEFELLTAYELYEIMALRQSIFVVEQECWYLDADGKDLGALHLMGKGPLDPANEKRLLSYARIFRPGVVYNEASIGRIVVAKEVRGQGHGKELLRKACTLVEEQFGPVPIRIWAQRYLEKFYGDFGFITASEPGLEDGIWHIEMVRKGSPRP